MMKYEVFEDIVAEQFLQNMPAEFESYKVRLEKVDKVNQILGGLTLVLADGICKNVLPIIYVTYIYEDYQHNEKRQNSPLLSIKCRRGLETAELRRRYAGKSGKNNLALT